MPKIRPDTNFRSNPIPVDQDLEAVIVLGYTLDENGQPTPVGSVNGPVPNRVPTYEAGTNGGTINVPADAYLKIVSAYADGMDGTFTIDGGDQITVRADVGKVLYFDEEYLGALVIEFSASLDYEVFWAV